MLVIEFCGLPGCGKSTVCDLFEETLKNKKIEVKNLHKRIVPNHYIDKAKYAVWKRWCHWIWPEYKLRKLVINYGKVMGYTLLDKEFRYWHHRIIEAAYLIQRNKNSKDVLMFDEGFLQYITSISHEDILPKEANELFIYIMENIYFENTCFVHCQVKMADNVNRLKRRNKINDRFLVGEDDEIYERLKLKNDNIISLLDSIENFEKYELETYDTEKNVEDLIGLIDKYIN